MDTITMELEFLFKEQEKKVLEEVLDQRDLNRMINVITVTEEDIGEL
jgi:hypothetical protein